jgi:hypothetical protein
MEDSQSHRPDPFRVGTIAYIPTNGPFCWIKGDIGKAGGKKGQLDDIFATINEVVNALDS